MRTRIPALFLFAMLVACGAFSRQAPEVRAYLLRADRPIAEGGEATAVSASLPILEVRELRLSPRYDTRSFVYRTSEHGFEADFYHEFFGSPGDLVSEEARRWLQSSGLFAHVVGPESRVLSEYVLEGQLVAIYGDYSRSARHAVLELQFFLIREPGSEVVATSHTRTEVPLTGRGPDALTAAWSTGLAEALATLEQRLAAHLTDG